MWERFTDRARDVVDEARTEAGRLGSDFVRGDHIMLGICKVPEPLAVRALKNLNVDLDALSLEIGQHTQRGSAPVDGYALAWTPDAKNVLASAAEEARRFNHSYIGTIHILLGFMAVGTPAGPPSFLAWFRDKLSGASVREDAIITRWQKRLPTYGETRSEIKRLLGESGRDPA